MVLKMVVDTCVWLDLAKDHQNQPVLSALEDLIKNRAIELLVPRVVLEEFERSKDRVIEETRRSFQSHFKVVREAVDRFAEDQHKVKTLSALNDVDRKMGIKGEAISGSIEHIERILKSVRPLEATKAIKQRVTERALANKAPYHRARNSVGDAILIETYAAHLFSNTDDEVSYVFVTHNTRDFSELNGDRRNPHSDLRDLFNSPKSKYSVSMVDVLKSVDPDLLSDHDAEFNFSQQWRHLSELLEAEHLLYLQVWYNRHLNLRADIEAGEHHVVSEKGYSRNPYRQDQTLDTVWASAFAAAKRTEEKVGIENLGPWDDFEWGMINGKLSALRWVLGDEWDMLDT